MNYINYINYTKTPSDSTCLGEPLGGFCDVGFVVALYLSFFLIHIFFSASPLTLPWTIARFLDPFSPAYRRVIRYTFIFNHFVIFLPRARFLVGIFYQQTFFALRSFGTFWHKLLSSRLPWEPAVIPQNLQGFILTLETQTQPICSFNSQQSTIFYTS